MIKKQLLSFVLCLCMVLSLLPTAALAVETAPVEMGYTQLATGYYIPAVDSTTPDGYPADIRVVDATDNIPADGNYLYYDARNNTLTVHGQVELTSGGPSVLTATTVSLTITGETGSSLTMTGNQNPTVSVNDATLTLSGGVDFTATATSALAVFGGMATAEGYTGDISLTAPASSPVLTSVCSLTTTGDITLRHTDATSKTVLLAGSGDVVLTGANVTVATVDTNTSSLFSGGESTVIVTATTGNVMLENKGSNTLWNSRNEITATALNGAVTKALSSGTTTTENGMTYIDITEEGLHLTSIPEEKITYKAGKGTVTLTPSNDSSHVTLTLNNATLERMLMLEVDVPFTIDLIGENTLTMVMCMQEPTITGTGTLNALVDVLSMTNTEVSETATIYGKTALEAGTELVLGKRESEGITQTTRLIVSPDAVLTIPDNRCSIAVLNLECLDNQGTIINNGDISLFVAADDTDTKIADAVKFMKLDPSGTSTVYIRNEDEECIAVYTNDGVKLNEPAANDQNIDEGDLRLIDESGDAVATTFGNGYEWNADNKTLTLTNFYFEDTIYLPSETKIVTNGASWVRNIELDSNNNNVLTFSGTAPLTVTNYISMSQISELTVEEGAEVNVLEFISIGTSGGVDSLLMVNGKLTACNEYGTAINCGKVVIGSNGELRVTGEIGVKVNGMHENDDLNYDGAFTMADGGKFIANCTDCNVMVYAGTTELTAETANQAIVIPESYLPDGYAVRIVNGMNGGNTEYAVTIAKTDATLTLDSESISGAGGSLSLPKQSSDENDDDGDKGDGNEGDGNQGNGNQGNSSSSNITTYYTITTIAGAGGYFSTDTTVQVLAGNSASFTIIPNKGYTIADVVVDGKSVGAVSNYVFTNVQTNHTISATFTRTGHANPQTGIGYDFTDVD